jgi:hypothetical protein
MAIDKVLGEELTRFKRYRDALVYGDPDDLEQHLRDFVREVERNTLIASIRAKLPNFDVEEWWKNVAARATQWMGQLDVIDFPDGEDDRLVVLWDLAKSMASGDPKQLTVRGFGQILGRHKMADAASITINLVLRPLADMLADKIRDEVEMANPAVRELAGVPLDRIPAEGETVIFLSHKSIDKDIVRPYYHLLKELGLEPWLDEADLKAGDTLHREIADAFDHSCAVVFFVTKNFKDERWLKREVDHAVNRLIERDGRFVIITLVFDDAELPRPLQERLYVKVANEVDTVRAIIRALPVEVGPPRWRKGSTSAQ